MGRIHRGFVKHLGVTRLIFHGEIAYNFALFSKNAQQVKLCIFYGENQEITLDMYPTEEHIWNILLVGNFSGKNMGLEYMVNIVLKQVIILIQPKYC